MYLGASRFSGVLRASGAGLLPPTLCSSGQAGLRKGYCPRSNAKQARPMTVEAFNLATQLTKALEPLEGAPPYQVTSVDLRRGDITLLLKALGLLEAVRDATE
jgi:hypothetical protein